MRRILWGVLWLAFAVGIAGIGLWLFGPYERVETEIAFAPDTVPSDIEGWLADSEAQVADLRPEAAKRILWAGRAGQRTDLAIVYLHGFSADPWEIRPVPDRVAERLGANLFFQRLTGHGRPGAALAEASAGDWLEDVAEAMEIGRRLGDRVVVMATSTGGTLAALLSVEPSLAEARRDLAGVILVSPNFRVANPSAALLSWPAARYWVPLIAGPTRRFVPQNDRHRRHWMTEYPTIAVLPMQALLDHASRQTWSEATVPALFYYAEADSVVDAAATARVARDWGGPVQERRVTLTPGDDPTAHVIAGDILSPSQTPFAVDVMVEWISGLR